MYRYYSVLGFTFAICSVVVIAKYFSNAYKKKILRFTDREDLSVEEIYSRYFSNKNICKKTMISLWAELAERLELPKEKLRPSDRFDKELAPESEKFETIFDFIMFFSSIERNSQELNNE